MLVWKWKYKGMECIITKHDTIGHYCGYVGLPKGHPDWGKDYNSVDIVVHGELTFGMQGDGSETWADKEKWYFGIDFAHAGDYIPNMPFHYHNDHKWTLEEVIKEIEEMSEQFIKRKGGD